jgi:SAM-dependent methyltransferase
MLVEWAEARQLRGGGRRALVVGCGLGDDAEYIAGLGYETVAFDAAASAVRTARRRFPDSAVRYLTADVLSPPPEWRQAFDLVVEIYTIQVLRGATREQAIQAIGGMVAAGGTLIVIARAPSENDDPGMVPLPLTRVEVDAFAAKGLRAVRVEHLPDPGEPEVPRWRAEFVRPAG